MQGLHCIKTSTDRKETEVPQSCPPDFHSAPWLIFFHGKHEKRSQTFFSLSEKRFYVRSILEMRNHECWETPEGWLLLLDPPSGQCFLLNPTTMAKIELPPMERVAPDGFSKCCLSSSPIDPNCVVMCIDFDNSYVMFCSLRDNKWIWHKYVLEKKHQLVDVVTCEGRFYARTLQSNLAVLDFAPQPKITLLAVGNTRVPSGLTRTTCVLESCGEIFLVERYLLDVSEETVKVCVFKINWSRQKWEIVDDIGDRVFFMGCGDYCSASLSASELGMKKNCIYFTQEDKHLYVYDLDEGTISWSLPCPNVKRPWSPPFFLMPTV